MAVQMELAMMDLAKKKKTLGPGLSSSPSKTSLKSFKVKRSSIGGV